MSKVENFPAGAFGGEHGEDTASTDSVSFGPQHLVPDERHQAPPQVFPVEAGFVIRECVNGFEGYSLPPNAIEIGE